jgi:hypothetical protein
VAFYLKIAMITLHPHPENVLLCDMRMGKKTVPVYWHPKKNDALKNSVEDIASFFTPELRNRFELSSKQADTILDHLKAGTVPESIQSKFFKVKRFIDESLFTEMDIQDTPHTFEINFPAGSDTWPNNTICAGATNSGKTYSQLQRVLRNLNGPKKNRRHFLWFSSEWDSDKTIKELKKDKYREYVRGKDISDQSVKDSEHDTPEEFFEAEIKMLCDNAVQGTCCIFDDPVDAAEGLAIPIRRLINKSLRVSRHKQTGLIFILHRIRSGAFSIQGHNSCKYFCLFPRSQKGKCVQFLNQDMGLTLGESRRMVHDFGQQGRQMNVQLFAPNSLIGDKLIRLI